MYNNIINIAMCRYLLLTKDARKERDKNEKALKEYTEQLEDRLDDLSIPSNSQTNDAKKGAAEDSAYGVLEAAKLFYIINRDDFGDKKVKFNCNSSGMCKGKMPVTNKEETLEIYGTKPAGGTIEIGDYEFIMTDLIFGSYKCSKSENETKITCVN